MTVQHPMFRNTDPETSREAYLSVSDFTTKQSDVLAIARRLDEYTLEELVTEYKKWTMGVSPQSDSGIRTRHKELVDRDIIIFTGKFGTTSSGRNARIWRVDQEPRTGVGEESNEA